MKITGCVCDDIQRRWVLCLCSLQMPMTPVFQELDLLMRYLILIDAVSKLDDDRQKIHATSLLNKSFSKMKSRV